MVSFFERGFVLVVLVLFCSLFRLTEAKMLYIQFPCRVDRNSAFLSFSHVLVVLHFERAFSRLLTLVCYSKFLYISLVLYTRWFMTHSTDFLYESFCLQDVQRRASPENTLIVLFRARSYAGRWSSSVRGVWLVVVADSRSRSICFVIVVNDAAVQFLSIRFYVMCGMSTDTLYHSDILLGCPPTMSWYTSRRGWR